MLGKDTTKVQFNYYTNGVGNHEYMYDLGFDASEGYHTYGFDWQKDSITWYVDGKAVYSCPPEEFVRYIPEFLAAGVAIFGGCCGTTAAHIAALRDALAGAEITPPAPQHTDMLPASTEKLPAYLPVDAVHGPVLTVTDDLESRLSAVLDGGDAMAAIRVDTWEDVDGLADVQYMITKPLCLVTMRSSWRPRCGCIRAVRCTRAASRSRRCCRCVPDTAC